MALPRRKRYGPFLAGMAIDVTILSVALGLRFPDARTGLALPSLLDRMLAALVTIQCLSVVYQWLLLFLRSDGYAIIANALRCHNLYRATALTAKQKFYRLNEDERAELAAIGDHDRAVARWFSLVYGAGLVGVAWTMATWGVAVRRRTRELGGPSGDDGFAARRPVLDSAGHVRLRVRHVRPAPAAGHP